jgi:hypothetical protein
VKNPVDLRAREGGGSCSIGYSSMIVS